MDKIGETRFEDWYFTAAESSDPAGILIDTDNPVAAIRQTRTGNQSRIAGADNCNSHEEFRSCPPVAGSRRVLAPNKQTRRGCSHASVCGGIRHRPQRTKRSISKALDRIAAVDSDSLQTLNHDDNNQMTVIAARSVELYNSCHLYRR
jgi:hypothetical protein